LAREPHFQLIQKVHFLIKDPKARKRCGHYASQSSFAVFTGVERGQLALAIGQPDTPESEGNTPDECLSPENSKRIANKCKFGVDWPEWMTGTAEAFIGRYEKLTEEEGQVQATDGTKAARDRHLDRPIKAGPRRDPIPCKIKGLGSIEIEGGQYGRGSVYLGATISCGRTRDFASICHARIEINCGGGMQTTESRKERTANRLAITSDNKNTLTVFASGGHRGAPAFDISSDNGGSLGNFQLLPDFLIVESLAPGDVVTATLGTWFMDIDEAKLGDGIVLLDRDGSALALPSHLLSDKKWAVIAALRKLVLPDEEGYVVVCTHELPIIEDNRDVL
jgi:hypothetical protein